MKWLVRIGAGMLIAVLCLTMFRWGGYARLNIFLGAAILYGVGKYEGIDMRGYWGKDDDEDGQGPLRPA
jgi:hypothetical protein